MTEVQARLHARSDAAAGHSVRVASAFTRLQADGAPGISAERPTPVRGALETRVLTSGAYPVLPRRRIPASHSGEQGQIPDTPT